MAIYSCMVLFLFLDVRTTNMACRVFTPLLVPPMEPLDDG
jgi:hypothetical protein